MEEMNPEHESHESTLPTEPGAPEENALIKELEQLEEAQAVAAAETAEAEAEEAIAEADGQKVELTAELEAYLSAAMEALLFMHDKPVSLPRLRALIDKTVPLSQYRRLVQTLKEEYQKDHRGIEISEVSLGLQLRTKPHMSAVLRNLVKTQPLKLTGSMMEALSVVAYKQPVTKDEIDQIRGVDCGYLLRTLMEKKLIRMEGRSDLPGRPILYATTHEFLELFCLKDLSQLPPLREIESMVAQAEVGLEEEDRLRLAEFGGMVDASLGTVLFDDSKIDDELDSIRSTIEGIRTSTDYLENQKAQERWRMKSAEMRAHGATDEAIIEKLGPEPVIAMPEPTVEVLTAAEADANAEADAIAAEMVAASASEIGEEEEQQIAPQAPTVSAAEGMSWEEVSGEAPLPEDERDLDGGEKPLDI